MLPFEKYFIAFSFLFIKRENLLVIIKKVRDQGILGFLFFLLRLLQKHTILRNLGFEMVRCGDFL